MEQNAVMAQKNWLTVKEAAEQLAGVGVDPASVYYLTKIGRIKARQFKRGQKMVTYRISVKEVARIQKRIAEGLPL